MGVSEIRGTFLGSLLQGNPTIWGAIFGSLIFVNPHIRLCHVGAELSWAIFPQAGFLKDPAATSEHSTQS